MAEAGRTDLEFRIPGRGFGDIDVRFLPDRDGWVPSDVYLSLKQFVEVWSGGEKRLPVNEEVVSVQGIRSGRYRLRIRHPRLGLLDQQVVIQAGQKLETIVDLRKLAGRIEVRVKDEQARPVVGAWVGRLPLVTNKINIDDPWGLYWRPSRRLEGELTSDRQGRALLMTTQTGEGLVMVWKPGFVPFARRVQGGDGPITAQLRKSNVVRFQITKKTLGATKPEQPWAMRLRLLSSEVRHHDPRLDKGVTFLLYGLRPYSLDTLPAGRYRLEGRRPGGIRDKSGTIVAEIRREFLLAAGKPLELDL